MNVRLILLALCLPVNRQRLAQIEPGAGSWKTWVIPSGKAYPLPPPPDAKATQAEWKELLYVQRQWDSSAIRLIKYWNAEAPGYRWQTIAEQLYYSFPPAWVRAKALMNVAIYDATVAAWQSKQTYRRPRPSQNKALTPYLPDPDSPSYPSLGNGRGYGHNFGIPVPSQSGFDSTDCRGSGSVAGAGGGGVSQRRESGV